MYGTRKPLNVGINASVGVEPQAQSSATVNNTVIVKTSGNEDKHEQEPVTEPNNKQQDAIKSEVAHHRSEVDAILLEVFSNMLLYQNKPLLANIVSKNSIIITTEDLIRVIEAKTNKHCTIILRESDEAGCFAKVTPIRAIESIRISDEHSEQEFKVANNADYIELMNVYHLSLKYVVC